MKSTVLQIPDDLHGKIMLAKKEAKAKTSLNTFIVDVLQKHFSQKKGK